jgi:hypothetical protein
MARSTIMCSQAKLHAPVGRVIAKPEVSQPLKQRRGLCLGQFFLDAQLALLEFLDRRSVGHRPVHFLTKLSFKALVFGLECFCV